MENARPSVFWWILGAKRSLWLTPMFLETNSPKNMNPPNGGAYSKPIMRRLCRGGDEQIDVKIQFTGVVDGSVSLPRVAQYGVSPYLVPNLPWDMVLGHLWGYEHCVSHFARFNCLYSHHPVHPRFWIEDFREAPRTGKPFLVKPIHGKVSRQSVWGLTVPVIGAVTPTHPAPAIVVTPPGGEPPDRVEAEKHISYALTASSVALLQDRACALELVEFAPETLARDVLPTRRDGSMWTQSDYGLTPYWAARVKKQFGKNPDVDAFNRVPGMAQATRWVSPLEDFFSTPADPSRLYWMCPPYHRFSDCVRKIRHIKLRAIVVGPKWTHREWWKPLMEITLQGYHLPGPETKACLYQNDHLPPILNRVGPRWRYTWTVVLRRKIWRPLNVMWPPFWHRPSLTPTRMASRA